MPSRLAARPGNIALAVIITSMNQMASAAQFSGLPYIQPLILLGIAIVNTIQQMKENRHAFAQLASDTHTMLKTISDVVRDRHGLSVELERNVKTFIDVLEGVLALVKDQQYRGALLRLFLAAEDAKKIEGCRSRITTALHSFEVNMQMRTHDNIVLILRENSERRARPPSYTVATTDPAIPEDINSIAETDFDRLLPILGVVSVFQEFPTTLQIARVLNLEADDIYDVWEPISSHLNTLNAEGRIRCLKYLEDLVCRRGGTASIDRPKYHNLVAQWCLGHKACARDAFYAADSWVHHVCQSSPSSELREALKYSDTPLDPISHDDLPEVISWMERIPSPDEEWRNLLNIYQGQLSGVPLTPYLADGWIRVEL